MTRTIDPSGGSAFPLPDSYTDTGMTLWDYYAAHALQGLLASDPLRYAPDCAADLAGQYAMALLEERKDHIPPHWQSELPSYLGE